MDRLGRNIELQFVKKIREVLPDMIGINNSKEKFGLIRQFVPGFNKMPYLEQTYVENRFRCSLRYIRCNTDWFVVHTTKNSAIHYFVPQTLDDLKDYKNAIDIAKKNMDMAYAKGIKFVKYKEWKNLVELKVRH